METEYVLDGLRLKAAEKTVLVLTPYSHQMISMPLESLYLPEHTARKACMAKPLEPSPLRKNKPTAIEAEH